MPGSTDGRGGEATPDATERAELLARLPTAPGLCASCEHLRFAVSARSVFVRCALADSDARFPRYPPLPVERCTGYTVCGS